jgi:hypothetical protein
VSFAQVFENRPEDIAGRRALLSAAVEKSTNGDKPLVTALSAVPAGSAAGGRGRGLGAGIESGPDDQGVIPVGGPLSELLPDGVRRGDVVAIETESQSVDYLTLALLAGALDAGLWCGVVGVPEMGALALAELASAGPAGVDLTELSSTGNIPAGAAALERLLLVPEPGEQWAEIVAVLADGVDLVLVRPSTAVTAAVSRRVDARLRQGRSAGTRHSAALLVLGSWGSARLVLRTTQTVWSGLAGVGTGAGIGAGAGANAGTGHLTGGRATIVAEGRATGGRARTVQLWLPTAAGTMASLRTQPAPIPGSSANGADANNSTNTAPAPPPRPLKVVA